MSIVLAEPTHSWNGASRTDLDRDKLLALRNPRFQMPNLLVGPVFAARLAPGHDTNLNVTPNWDFGPPFAGAGALRSTVHDQLTFIEAMLGSRPSPLAGAMGDTIGIRRSRGDLTRKVGLGWGIDVLKDDEMVVHGGETAGYSALVAFLRQAAVGIVVLSNARRKIADIGFHLINPDMSLSNAVTL